MFQTATPALLEDPLETLVAEYFSEPIGIVISSGSRTEPTPRVAEYVWGPVPDERPEATTSGKPRAV